MPPYRNTIHPKLSSGCHARVRGGAIRITHSIASRKFVYGSKSPTAASSEGGVPGWVRVDGVLEPVGEVML